MANPFVKGASVRAPCAWAGQPLAFSEPLIPPTTGTAGRIPPAVGNREDRRKPSAEIVGKQTKTMNT